MPSPTPAAIPQRDARAAALLEQGRRQKAELDRMVKSSFAHTSSSSSASLTSRAGRMHPKDASAKLLDADIDFARRNLRNTWLNLLFTCTFTREAQAIDGYVWNDTSYTLISAYRAYISAAQKAVDPASVQAPGRRGKSAQDAQRVKAEYRKFLVDEELFWHELVGRLVRLFSLDEARANLEALGIDADNDADSSLASSLPSDSFASRTNRHDNEPDESLSQAALLPAKRIHLITLLHKFLIFCGDLARYREMSSHDAPADTASSTSKKTKPAPKYDFSRASAFYEQARLLLPDQGNPANQLAVVSTYKGDLFASLYYYYRALCVKTPFAKAKINLEKLLAKPTAAYLDQAARATDASAYVWDAAKDAEARHPQQVARLAADVELAERSIEAWLKQVVVLHGLFYRRSHLDHISYLSRSVLATFSTLVRARALRADQVVQFLVTALCASWTTRLWRSAPSSSARDAPRPSSEGSEDPHRPRAIRSERSSRKRAPSPETGRCVEFQVTAHVLGVFRELAAVDTAETREALEVGKATGQASDAAGASPIRHLTAVVRRTLPALRIVTKWTKTHLEYMQRIEKRAREAVEQLGEGEGEVVRSGMEVRPDSERPHPHHTAYVDTLEAMERCWSQYVDLINGLRWAFPFDSLPNIGKVGAVGAPALCLEEDSDMRGFAPTRKATQSTIPGGTTISVGMGEACANVEAVRPSQVHPNEEQLMRIADLMIDAKVIAESDASPIVFDDTNNVFVYRRRAETKADAAAAAQVGQASRDELASSASVDDPVEAAMRAAVGRPAAPSDGAEADVDSMEQSLRSVDLQNAAAGATPALGGEKGLSGQLLVPSQVRAKAAQNKDELARQLFAAYPLASAPGGTAELNSPTAAHGAPLSSIWAPSASDMGAATLPAHLASYGGRSDLYQRPMQSAYPAPSWPNHGYAQQTGAAFADAFGNTTPDPFNPHAYGAAAPMHSHHAQMHYPGAAPYAGSPLQASQQRMTPRPGDVHGARMGGAGTPMQDPYYPGAGGPGASHPPHFG